MLTMVGVQIAIRRRGLLRNLRSVYEVLDACRVSERVAARSGCSVKDASESAASDVPGLVPERDVQLGDEVVEPVGRDVAELVSGALLHGRLADEMQVIQHRIDEHLRHASSVKRCVVYLDIQTSQEASEYRRLIDAVECHLS